MAGQAGMVYKLGAWRPATGGALKVRADFETYLSRQDRQTRDQLTGVMGTLAKSEQVNFMRGTLMFNRQTGRH